MLIPQALPRGLIATVLLCAAVGSTALTLGRSQGAALIGRPLDVAIALTLDSPGQADDLCPEVDVFHGDSRVDRARVSVRIEPARGQDAVVRVRSSQPVDEPVVTLYLRLGCNQKTTRRYVLLSEEPGELPPAAATLPSVVPAAAAPVSRAAPQSIAAAAPATAAVTPRQARAQAQVPRARRSDDAGEPTTRGAAVAKSERALVQSQRQRDASAGRASSRLKLDMLDLLPERDPSLRLSAGLAGAPSTSEQVRAEAAALWRSINAQPQDVLQDLQRVQALESDVKSLRDLVAGNDRTLVELRGRLNQAQQERSLTLAAIALLALLLAAMVVTWWLRRGEREGYREWWRRGDSAAAGRTAAPVASRVEDVDLRVDESMFDSLKPVPRMPVVVPAAAAVPARASVPAGAAPNSAFHSSFQSSQAASMRMVKAEELVDIQQQADFFMSLGQTEQAIDVLESHIRTNVETSALVWLDLLAIYRALKRRQDYERLRGDFQRVFNAEVPTYDSTPTVSGGLEDYPRALSRISALWPSPKVMDVIEESIFRKPGTGEGEPFDLEAYRELVMLYNLGREVVQAAAVPAADRELTDAPASTFFETSMQPLSVARDSALNAAGEGSGEHGFDRGNQAEAMDTPFDVDSMLGEIEGPDTGYAEDGRDPQMPRPSPRLGLDIDLSGPSTAGAPAVSLGSDTDSSTLDFELSEPGDVSPAGPHRNQ